MSKGLTVTANPQAPNELTIIQQSTNLLAFNHGCSKCAGIYTRQHG